MGTPLPARKGIVTQLRSARGFAMVFCVRLHGARDALALLQGMGYMQHLHPEDFEVDTQLAGATSFPVWLTFPAAGVWTFHTSVDLTPPRARAPVTVSRQQTLRVGGAAEAAVRSGRASATAGSDRNTSYLTTVLVSPSHKGAAPQGHDAMATLPAARAVPGAMAVTVATPSGGIYEHECSRLVFEFSDAETGQPVDALLPWLHASMHVLDAAPAAEADSDGFRGVALAQSHGVPEALDEAVLGGDQQHGLDLCNVEMERVPTAAAATGGKAFGPRMVWYARFAGAGTHYVFVQVRAEVCKSSSASAPLSSKSISCGCKHDCAMRSISTHPNSHALQIMRGEQMHVVRVPVTVQAITARIIALPTAERATKDTIAAADAHGFEVELVRSPTGSQDDAPSPVRWSQVQARGGEPLVALVHANLDWFGVVPLASTGNWTAQQSRLHVPLAVPASGTC